MRIVDDIDPADGFGTEKLGRLATYVRDRRIPLELCPTSNVNTGVVPTIADHPIGMLRRLRFRVTLNTDNRLMSDTSMTKEMVQLADAFGWGLDDFEWLTVNAMKSAFAPFPERLRLINGVIKPRYAILRVRRVTRRGLTMAINTTLVDHPVVADALDADPRSRHAERAVPPEPRAHRHAAARRGHADAARRSTARSRRR